MSPEDPLLGMVCRNNHQIFTSSGHQMTVLFHSDNSVTQRGFQAFYYSFPTSSSTTGKTRAVLYPLPGKKHKIFLKGLLMAPDTYGHPDSLSPTDRRFGLEEFTWTGLTP